MDIYVLSKFPIDIKNFIIDFHYKIYIKEKKKILHKDIREKVERIDRYDTVNRWFQENCNLNRLRKDDLRWHYPEFFSFKELEYSNSDHKYIWKWVERMDKKFVCCWTGDGYRYVDSSIMVIVPYKTY